MRVKAAGSLPDRTTGVSQRSRTLLLADDSVTIQRVIELTFAEEDFRVVAVSDGQQAIDHLSVDAPDIVLADIGMPKRSGYEVATFVKTQPALAGIPVLLLTGAFEAVDEARVRASGADGVLVKPFEPSAVIGRVKELLGIGRGASSPAPSGRLITTADGPRAEARGPRPEASPPAAPASPAAPPPAASPGSWEELRAETGLGPETASVEGQPVGGDDYFDSLDAAFDTLDQRLSNPSAPGAPAPPARPQPPAAKDGHPPVFEVEDEWFGEEVANAAREQATQTLPAPEAPPGPVPAAPVPTSPTPAAAPTGATFAGPPMASVADAFAVFLADEQGDGFAAPAPAVPVTEHLIDEVTARVAARLATGGLSDEVRAIVVEAAERLVREEIRRIRGEAERRR